MTKRSPRSKLPARRCGCRLDVRVLLDESLPKALGRMLHGHDVRTVAGLGWAGVRNGELLPQAAIEGFDAFVTADQNLAYQQNVAHAGLGVIVTVARSNRVADILPLAPSIAEALTTLGLGQVVWVGTKLMTASLTRILAAEAIPKKGGAAFAPTTARR